MRKEQMPVFLRVIRAKRLRNIVISCLMFATFPWVSWAEMTSTNYIVQWDAFAVGSSDTATSASYSLRGSLDYGVSASDLSSASYIASGGFRAGVFDPVSTFVLLTQYRASQVAATSATATTVTVTSASGFAVNDYILLVQDEGSSQVAALGQVTDISGSIITVDAFSGGSPVIDGAGGDYVYELSSGDITLPLATPSASSVITGVVAWDVNAETQSGYSVYIYEDDDLRISGGDVLPDVADGTVSAGSSEYGARSSDTSLATSTFDTQDTGITSSLALVASQGDVSFSSRDMLTLKMAMSSLQTAGAYSHNIFVIFSGSY